MLEGHYRGRGSFCPIPKCSPLLAAPALISMQGTQWRLPPTTFADTPEFFQHLCWLSREFSTVQAGDLPRKSHQHHNQFPKKFNRISRQSSRCPSRQLASKFQQHPHRQLLAIFVGTPVGSYRLASLSLCHLHFPLTCPVGHSHSPSEIWISVLRVGWPLLNFLPLSILHQP